ncbi:MAG: ABC transporter permease subunit [Dehalococcoidales bacterium]|nr:MAG: ABC transporter permease subunit [Dehalococcoidales bacterium]
MASFLVLLKKELKYQVRTYRLLTMVAVFFIFGLATPLLFHYLPELMPESEIQIQLPQFTTTDVVNEYLDTVGQIGMIATILVAMSAVARERELGTAAMTLSKPVGSGAFIAAKLASLALVFIAGIIIGALGCYLYTMVLYGDLKPENFFTANLVIGLYLLFCLAFTVMCSSFFKSQLAAGGLALVCLISLTVSSGLPIIKDYSPGALMAWSREIASGAGSNHWGVLIVSLVLIALTVPAGWQVFKRKEL